MTDGAIQKYLEAVRAVMVRAEFCFLISHSRQGELHARLMQPFLPEEDLTVWFGVNARSRKVHEIEANQLVTMAYHFQPESAYVSLQGRAALVDDLEMRRRYWRQEWSEFWTDGPEGDDYLLVRVQPYQIDIMNNALQVTDENSLLRPLILTKEVDEWTVLPYALE